MCGISVIIKSDNSPVEPEEIKRINDLIEHRGPDNEGFYFHSSLAFGHRRLSILDTSDFGNQPMEYMGEYWITYNGEIYNYVEIKEELVAKGYTFKSECDTEVILASYDCWGYDCLSRFNGMWAFCIHDLKNEKLFFSRDRFGIKPLYYVKKDNGMGFGSEIKQLINANGSNKLNEKILLEFMLTKYDDHTNETYFKGIYSLPASHYMSYNLKSNEFSINRYYSLTPKSFKDGFNKDTLVKSFYELLEDSIKLRLRSDVQVGTCLSGGLDSSAISVVAAKIYNKQSAENFLGINASSSDKRNDESYFANVVAENNNIELHKVAPTFEDFTNYIDELILTQEQPFTSPSMFMGYHVFKKAKDLGCKVMLNGQGGDEILLGYERYFSSTLNILKPVNFLRSIYDQSKNSRIGVVRIVLNYLYFRMYPIRISFLKYRSFIKREHRKSEHFSAVIKNCKAYSNPLELQKSEICELQLPHLLRYEDRNSMRHSIETRLPLLDYRLVEFCLGIPIEYKIRKGWSKFILRAAMDKILPNEVAWRKNKFGFEAPTSWLDDYADEMLKEIKESKILNFYCDMPALEKKFQKLGEWDKWLYFNIARWEKVYRVVR